jgi:3-deoxy-D-manno-octulosonic acid kinase
LPGQSWWVKSGWEEILLAGLGRVPSVPDTPDPTILGGRGASRKISLHEKETAIVRRYYRGGLIGRFVRDLYWDRPPRPWAELICTEVARQRAVPTVEVLAAGVAWHAIGLYRGTLVTREAKGFVNLWEWLAARPPEKERKTMAATVARTIARMHDAGIAHADLNLTNILAQKNAKSPTALVIDFDRARVFSGPVPPSQRQRNLRRLQRSLDKLDPGGLLTSPTDIEIFCREYQQTKSRTG